MEPTVLSPRNATVVTAIVAFVIGLRALAPAFFASPEGKRLLPVLPMVLGLLAGVLGLAEPVFGTDPQGRVAAGLLVGMAAMAAYKIGRTTVMGVGTKPAEPAAPSPTKDDQSP